MKTWNAKKEDVSRTWWSIDATDVPLGRLSTRIACVLRGKHKATFTPHVDTGDYVVVTNSKKVRLTGDKKQNKKYYSHSGYVGSLKEVNAETLLEKNPNEVILKAVKNMLPKNRLSRQVIKKLKIYSEQEHSHQPQNPQPLKLENK